MKGALMTQLERLKDELITLTVRRGYPAELGALMAALSWVRRRPSRA